MTPASRPRQQSLELRTWGGKRCGAGRKPARARAAAPHAAREELRPCYPVHVTFRVADYVWNLRSERSYRVIHAAVHGAKKRPGFRVIHFTILGNHLHLIVEADGTRAFALGVRGLSIRLALRLNRMMGREGRVFPERYHAHVLRTPAEVQNAIRYVLGNFESHAARRGEHVSTKGWVDPFSSAAARAPREAQGSLFAESATSPATTWLLRQAGLETDDRVNANRATGHANHFEALTRSGFRAASHSSRVRVRLHQSSGPVEAAWRRGGAPSAPDPERASGTTDAGAAPTAALWLVTTAEECQ